MKQTLQLRTSQQLTLTPQLQQSIRLLQMSTLDLNQELDRVLDENPMLERAEDGEADEVLPMLAASLAGQTAMAEGETAAAGSDTERPAGTDDAALAGDDGQLLWEGGSGGSDEDDDGFERQTAAGTSLRDHLIWQVQMSQLVEDDRQLVLWLIEAIDEDGYLTQPLAELVEAANALAAEDAGDTPGDGSEPAIDEDTLRVALRYLQTLDPPGVGAIDLAECLAIQLEALPADTPHRDLALQLVRGHLDALAGRDYNGLRRALGCDEAALRAVQALVTHLNPRPGSAFGDNDTRYVVPDVRVLRHREQWVVRLNADAVPRLRVNRTYAELLARNRGLGRTRWAAAGGALDAAQRAAAF